MSSTEKGASPPPPTPESKTESGQKENMRNAELLAEEDRFQLECGMMIFQFLEHRSGKFKINKSIQRLVKHLYYKYGLGRREIYSKYGGPFANETAI